MYLLSRSEEIILLAVWRLQEDAFGIAIRDEVQKATAAEWSVGAMYAPLHRLEKKGFIISRNGEPEQRRGGRSKVYYDLTKKGKQALLHTKEVHDVQWTGVPSIVLKFQG